MSYKTQAEIDAMMALPMSQRPAGWAWWQTQEQADRADAAEKAEQDKLEAARKLRIERIAAENKASAASVRGPGYCNKCNSYCYGDCGAN